MMDTAPRASQGGMGLQGLLIGLMLVVLALSGVALFFYEHTPQSSNVQEADLHSTLDANSKATQNSLGVQLLNAETRADLHAFNVKILASINPGGLEQSYHELQQRVAVRFQNTTGRAHDVWQALQPQLDRLATELDDKQAATETLNKLVRELE